MKALPGVRRKAGLLVVVGAFIITAAVVSPAVGGPSFLTMTKAKKAFFTKNQANRKFFGPAEGNGRYLPRSGEISLMIPPADWVPRTDGGDVGSIEHYGSFARMQSRGSGVYEYEAAVTLPVLLQGRPVRMKSIELCYDATSGRLDRLVVHKADVTAADPTPSSLSTLVQEDGQSDAACRTFAPTAPVTIDADDSLQIGIGVDAAEGAGSGYVEVARLSINLST